MDNVDAASDSDWASDVVSRAAALNLHAFINMTHGMVVLSQVCIGVPCHMLRCWAFLGIMLQVHLTFPYASHVLMPDHFQLKNEAVSGVAIFTPL